MQSFYQPTMEHLQRLDDPWCASFSGGKDSTSLVTWIEWLRRAGWLTVDRPQLVQSDTGVEDAGLQAVSAAMMDLLRGCGWECVVVRPETRQKLYPRILGIGNIPIHPGITSMRWCTRSTKIDPMERWRKEHSSGLTLTGLRMGESKMRDGKLIRRGCSAGGECGIPDSSDRTYSPLLNWTTCHVIDWLNGMVAKDVSKVMGDVFALTRQLVEIYGVRIGQPTFDWSEPEIKAARFGCIGCPAIQVEAFAPPSVVARYGEGSPLLELYSVWFDARRRRNRLFRPLEMKRGNAKKDGYGPIKLSFRPLLFERVMCIQRRAGVTLITPEDEAFIRQCWRDKVYPKGWSEADEAILPPNGPLYAAG
jgi:DNA sulfur modification protein DndC